MVAQLLLLLEKLYRSIFMGHQCKYCRLYRTINSLFGFVFFINI